MGAWRFSLPAVLFPVVMLSVRPSLSSWFGAMPWMMNCSDVAPGVVSGSTTGMSNVTSDAPSA